MTEQEVFSLFLLSQDDLETCRAFGIPRMLMRAVRHPEVRGTGRCFIARVRDVQTHFSFSSAVLCDDNSWVTLLDAYDPVAGDTEVCAIDVRVVDLLTVTMNHAEPSTKADDSYAPF